MRWVSFNGVWCFGDMNDVGDVSEFFHVMNILGVHCADGTVALQDKRWEKDLYEHSKRHACNCDPKKGVMMTLRSEKCRWQLRRTAFIFVGVGARKELRRGSLRRMNRPCSRMAGHQCHFVATLMSCYCGPTDMENHVNMYITWHMEHVALSQLDSMRDLEPSTKGTLFYPVF